MIQVCLTNRVCFKIRLYGMHKTCKGFQHTCSVYLSIHLASFSGSLGGGVVWREESLVYTVCAYANSVHRIQLPYRIRSCISLIMNYSYKLASPPLLRPSIKRFRTPLGVSSVPIYALGPLTEQRGQRSVPFFNVALHNYTAWVRL